MTNKILNKAKKLKNDEFYTQLADIEKELKYYKDQFKDKIVLCNCDDPLTSNFFKYFALNFNMLYLKKLIATCYEDSMVDLLKPQKQNKATYIEFYGVPNDRVDFNKLDIKFLKGNGDFRSEECIEFLKEADIVVTNPPFSLFREFVLQLIHYNKQFLILGIANNISYNDIFPLIKNNKMWPGITNFNDGMYFYVPDDFKYNKNYKFKKEINDV